MKYRDITLTIRPDLPIWPGNPLVVIRRSASLEAGDPANVSRLELGAHTGTHIDAPLHFVAGRKGIDQIDLEVLIGPAHVAEFDVEREITAAALEAASLPAGATRLLCKTRNSRHWTEHPTEFVRDFVGLSPDAAEWLVDHGYQLVGVDYLGIERPEMIERGAPSHHTLLDAAVIIVEGLNLVDVPADRYTLMCLPIKIQNGDGAPCRALLIEEQ